MKIASTRCSTGILCWLLSFLFFLAGEQASAQVSGTVFRDFNANGIYEAIPASGTYAYGESTVAGIVVTAYNAANTAVTSVTTNSAGTYTLTSGITNGTAYRIEFTGLTTGDFTSPLGSNNGSSVQFVTAATTATAVNFGINYPTDYCQANPPIATACYVFGNQLTGNNNADPVFITFPFNAGSRAVLINEGVTPASGVTGTAYPGAYDQPTAHTIMTAANKVGTTFGIAYARSTKTFYAASYFKKHTGFGPGGPSAIYLIDGTTGAVSTSFSVPNATTNSHNTTDYFLDNGNTAWDAVGKTSLGGMDLSDDEQTLYVMNLENRNLYALNATTGAVKANQPMTAVTGCPVGDVRPFAVEFRRGTLYVGIVCTAESTPTNNATLRGYVYTVNPTTLVLGANPVFQFPLTYPRGKAASTGPANWLPWRATYTNISTSANTPATSPRIVYPMPMLANIDFDANNDLIIGLRDRLGDIAGHNTPDNINSTTLVTQGRIAGDVLRAASTGVNSWTLESNGRVGGRGTSRQNTNQGPGGAEFYQGDSYPISSSVTGAIAYAITSVTPTYNYTITTGASTVGPGQVTASANGYQGFGENHDEVSLGTVLQLPGQGELMSLVFDPTLDNDADGFYDGGVRRMSNVTGGWTQAYRIYTGEAASTDDFGKAAGLSEPIAQCNPAPIEIGNRVWNDVDNDGIQEANETSYTAVSGLTVQLLQNGTVISTTTVSATGTYLFSSASTPAIQPNTAYQIRLVLPNNTRAISTPLTGTNRAIDSDANLSGVVSLTTGDYGENDHTYDIGVFVCVPPTGTTSFTNATCANGVPQLTARISVTAVTNATQANISAGSTYTLAAGFNSPTNQTVTSGAVSFSGLASGTTYTVRLFNGATNCFQDYVVTIPAAVCCGIALTNVVASACNTTNNQFTTTGTVTLSNVPAAGTLYVSNGAYAQTFAVTPATTAVSFTFVAESDGITRTISTSLASCGTASTTVPSPTACFVACPSSCGLIGITRYNTTADANAQFRYQGLAAEARYGNGTTNTASYEVDFNRVTPTSSTLVNGQYNWTSGAANSFTFAYDPSINGPNRAVFTLSSGSQSVSIQVNPQLPPTGSPLPVQFNAIQLSLQASNLIVASAQVSNLSISGIPLNTNLAANSALTLTDSDDIILRSSQVGPAFTLTGTLTFTWAVTAPSDNGLSLNIRLGVVNDCAAIPVTTVNSATIACQATSTTLTATSSQTGIGYQWTGPNNFTANTQSVTVTATGTYTVVSTNLQTGCTSTTTAVVTRATAVTATVTALPSTTICPGTAVTLTANASGGTGFTYAWSPAGTGNTQTVIVTPTTTTTYSVVVTNSNQCSTTVATTITVNPAVTATVASQTICNGTSATLTANATGGTGFTYAWSTGASTSAITVSPTSTTAYSVTVTNNSGCSAIASATVTVNPAVTAVITASPGNTICQGTATTLTASGGTTYQWSTGAQTAAITVSPTSTTAYSVTVTNASGCSAVATATVTVNPAVTATVASQTICQGNSATLTANASGGTGFTYGWTPAGTGNTQSVVVSPTATTTYTVTVTNSAGCSAVATATVTVNPAVTATVASQTVCNGTSATLTANASGGTGFTYTWSPAGTGNTQTVIVTPATTTTYSVTVTNATSCSTVATATVTVNPAVTAVITASPGNTICQGTATTLTASGGTTYRWSTGAQTAAITVSPANTTAYSVTVTNASGCSAIASTTVTVNPAVTATVADQTICNGTSATLTANATGGTGFTYAWSPAGTGATQSVVVSPTATTTYSVVVTNSTSCSTLTTATVTVNPAITATVASQTICNGTSATLTANTSGGTGFIYVWAPAGTGNTQTVIVSPSATTLYSVTVTNNTSCSTVATATVTVNPAVTATVTNQTICNGNTATLTASGGSSYRWSTGAQTATITVSPTNTTAYSVTVTNGSGCSAVATATVTVNPAVTATVASQTICYGTSTTLTANVAGGTGFTYTWSPAGTGNTQSVTVAPLTSTVYTVTVTNSTGCSAIASATVTVNPAVTATIANQTICNGTNTTLTANATGGTGFTYAWSTGASTSAITVSPTSTTAYSVTVTNSNGCSAVATATVTVNPAVTATVASQSICNGTSATLTANATGGTGFTYNWSPAGTGTTQTVVVSPTVTTVYTVTVTNNNGCSAVTTATVTVNPAVTATVANQTICNGTSATLTANATGGTGFTYRWSTGATTATITASPTSTTTYSVTVTSGSSCSAIATATVTVNPAVTATVANQTICYGTSTTLTANATGGTGFSYNWSPAGTGSTQSVIVAPLTTTVYTVTVTNSNGCSAITSATVTVNPAVTATVASQTICNGTSTTLTASASGGTGFTYAWSTGASTSAITVAPASTTAYSVTVTNNSGCSAIASATVTVNPSITATLSSATICNTTSATLTATGGTSYTFSNGTVNTTGLLTVSPTATTTYSVIVTNGFGCIGSASAIVTVNPAVTATVANQTICYGTSTTLTANATGGTGFTYNWSPAGTGTTQTVTVAPLATTVYSVTVTNSTGCSAVATATVTVNPAVTATVASQTICNGTSTTLTANASGGTGFTYAWSPAGTGNTQSVVVSPTVTTVYTVTVTNSNLCSTTATATVTVNSSVTATLSSATICNGTLASLTATGGSSYTFSNSTVNTTGILSVSPTATTAYSVTITNGLGCVGSASAIVTVNPAVTATVANQTICNGTSTTLTANASGGTGFTYNWLPAGTGNTQSVMVSPTATTTYSVVVTNSTSCSTLTTATVTVNPAVTATLSSATICLGNVTTLTATGGISYRFGPGITNTTGLFTVSPTAIGTNPYSVTVTSVNGCSAVATATVLVNPPPQPTISGNATLCAGQPISLTASPTTGLTYAWSGPTGNLGNANPLVIPNSTSANSGTYQVLVTNINGCTATASYNVTVKPAPVVQILNTSITCANNQPGVAIATQVSGGSPPVSYAWYRSGAVGVISTAPNPVFNVPDTYSVIVTDASGCVSNTATVMVMAPDPLAVNVQTANALCFNAQGRITVTVNGGMAPYTVRYYNSGGLISSTTTSGVSTLQTGAGSYSVVVMDANGCSLTQTATITQPPLLSVSLTSGGPVCAGQTTGTITSSVTGGTPAYSYSWNTGATTPNLTNLPGGSYSVVVTDANGCVTSQTITVPTNPLPPAPVVSVTQPTCVTLTGTIQVQTPATGVQYSVNNGIAYQASPTFSGLQPDVYRLTVKDNGTGCVSPVTSVTINPVPSPPVASISGRTVYCAGEPISLTASPTAGVTYAWSGPAGSLGNTNPLVVPTSTSAQSGVYRVTVTDVNGCTATASATITVNPAVTATVASQTICNGLSTTLTASGGTGYQWSTGATTPTIIVTPTSTTVYSVTVTNASTCSAIATATVTVNAAVTATVNSATLTCQAPVATLSVTSSQTGLTYRWAGPAGFTATTQSVTVAIPGTYTVVTTNAQTGCSSTTTATVTQLAGVEVPLFTQSNCLNNGTDATATDDYFTVTLQATNGTPGAAGRYDVVLGADANGPGGTVLNPGGTPYGTSVTVGGVGQPNARGFLANSSSIYSLTIRDSNNTTANTGCRSARLTGQVNPCSSCLPALCQPARLQKQ